MRAIVLLNPASGFVGNCMDAVNAVERAFAGLKMDLAVRPTHGHEIHAAVLRAVKEEADVVVAAGGDGTISAVAGTLAGGPVILGVLPMGTLNHFARDLGIPSDLTAAAKVIAAGHVRQVDMGEVNGHRFINNSSIGLYPYIVRRRDQQCHRLGRGKWIAMLSAAISIFRRYPLVSVVLETNQLSLPRKTPFVFIGNNRYEVNLFALGQRARLDAGELSVYSTSHTGRLGLLQLMFRALIDRLDQAEDFDIFTTAEVRIESRKTMLSVAFDGEVRRLRPPLQYRILPRALRVLAPRVV